MSGDADLDELRSLTRSLRAHLEWLSASGATGFERTPEPTAVNAPAVPGRGAPDGPRAITHALPAPSDAKPRLHALGEAVSACTRCRLAEQRTQTVFARGNGSSGVCFIGEGPGEQEDAQGLPFVGPAGQLLDKMIAAMGFDRDDVYVCNIVKCRPPGNRKPEPEEIATCRPFLTEQLELVAPKVIVALGATAVQGLLGTSQGIMALRGKWQRYNGIDVMPTFHPAYLLRLPDAKREVWNDLQAVLRHLGMSAPARR